MSAERRWLGLYKQEDMLYWISCRLESITMPEIAVGDRVQMRKKHPCGSEEWVVYRMGVDIGLRCAGCGRRVLLARSVFDKRLKQVLGSSPERREES